MNCHIPSQLLRYSFAKVHKYFYYTWHDLALLKMKSSLDDVHFIKHRNRHFTSPSFVIVSLIVSGPICYQNQCPESASGFPSRLTYSWFGALALTGFRRSLTESDLWALNPQDSSKEVVPRFDKFWERTLNKQEMWVDYIYVLLLARNIHLNSYILKSQNIHGSLQA